MLDAVDAADLVMLAFPLYVDSLPAPVMNALEHIAAHRASQAETKPHQLFAAISNCGFPEPDHNATALAICENFARLTYFNWAGSLALGAGEGMVHGMPLNELDGRVNPLRKLLTSRQNCLPKAWRFHQRRGHCWQNHLSPAGCIAQWECMAGVSKPSNTTQKKYRNDNLIKSLKREDRISCLNYT